MAYIGREPLSGEVILINSIESQFNGVLTTFNLTRTVNGVTSAFYPISSEQLLVSLGGVIQEPDPSGDTGFRISFNQIIFAIAPAAGVSCFIVCYGNLLDIGSPANNTVTTEKLVNGSVTPIKLSTGGPWWLTNGNVGIGTTNPGFNLDIYPSSGSAGVRAYAPTSNAGFFEAAGSNNTVRARLQSSGTDAWVGTITNHEFWIATNNDRKLTVTSSGYVGIGVTAPVAAFQVLGSNGAGLRVDQGNYNYHGAFNHVFMSSGFTSTFMTIDNAGSVGIGTTNPYSKLGVNGDITLGLAPAPNGSYGKLSWRYNNSASFGASAYIDVTQVSAGNSGNMIFATNNNSPGTAEPTERLRITSSGNVGIGTTNPTEKLDVRGNIFLPSSSYITKQFTDGVEDLILRGYGGFGWVPWISYTPSAGTANRGYKLGAYSNDGTAATWYYLWNGGLGLGVTPQKPLHIYSPKVQADSSVIRLENEDRKWDINIKSGKLVLGDDTATADRITVDTSGNVGIGTINPEAKLDVRGTVKISEIQNVPTDTIFLSKPGDASRLWTVFSQGTGSYRFGMGAAPYDLQLWYGLNSTASSPGSQILTINSAGKIGINTASTPTTLHIRQHGDDDGITISHPTRTGVWKWSHSGVNSENFAFKQNNGTSDAVSYVMGRNLHNWSIDNNEVFKITGSQSVARTTYPFYTHNSAMEIRFDDYLAGSYFYGHGGHFFMKPFVRGETNITVDILTLSNLTTFSGNTIYLEIIAASATTQQGCIIDGYAYLQQSNGSGIYNTSAGLTKRYEWSTGIGNGTLSWNGLTLQYTTVSPSYTKYQIRAFVVCHDSSIVTTAR